jgi:hypothetical protein
MALITLDVLLVNLFQGFSSSVPNLFILVIQGLS